LIDELISIQKKCFGVVASGGVADDWQTHAVIRAHGGREVIEGRRTTASGEKAEWGYTP
jgi:hypothetical protein